MSHQLFIAVGREYALVPGAKNFFLDKFCVQIKGGMYDGRKVNGVWGVSVFENFFTENGFKKVTIESLMEEAE